MNTYTAIIQNRSDKDDLPVVAICYDFDKTLTPDDMQSQGFIQKTGHDVAEFWNKSNSLAEENNMDAILAYMFSMKVESAGKVLFTKQSLLDIARTIELFPGVEEWFARINEYGQNHGIKVEHYIISSGLKEMIEGTSISSNFTRIYASSFHYNVHGEAIWPAQVVNYTNKTQFLFRIKKDALDVNDQSVNDYINPGDERVPFSHMIYIGDSDTDIPCMKLVNSYGGYSIGVYNGSTNDKTKVLHMMHDKRIKYYASADYTENSQLDELIKNIINTVAATNKLDKLTKQLEIECNTYFEQFSQHSRERQELIIDLENSGSFKQTHSIISKMRQYEWEADEKESLYRIACENSQVLYILNDKDVKEFYNRLLELDSSNTELSENAKEIRTLLNEDEQD